MKEQLDPEVTPYFGAYILKTMRESGSYPPDLELKDLKQCANPDLLGVRHFITVPQRVGPLNDTAIKCLTPKGVQEMPNLNHAIYEQPLRNFG